MISCNLLCSGSIIADTQHVIRTYSTELFVEPLNQMPSFFDEFIMDPLLLQPRKLPVRTAMEAITQLPNASNPKRFLGGWGGTDTSRDSVNIRFRQKKGQGTECLDPTNFDKLNGAILTKPSYLKPSCESLVGRYLCFHNVYAIGYGHAATLSTSCATFPKTTKPTFNLPGRIIRVGTPIQSYTRTNFGAWGDDVSITTTLSHGALVVE